MVGRAWLGWRSLKTASGGQKPKARSKQTNWACFAGRDDWIAGSREAMMSSESSVSLGQKQWAR
ncbi:hypothetical protein BKA80DRAFT_277192 [Phyllosticta citrichinensis]